MHRLAIAGALQAIKREQEEKKYAAIADPCTTERCTNPAMTWRGDVRYCTSCAERYDIRYGDR